ncbi:hypothetical protein K440DRAFT_646574 [Wilcoxina mikolae CBS 423.85]|nr:hypothetical protein K440DRAFT_646574 [Wilcoxina mikolae CBS 423.85]
MRMYGESMQGRRLRPLEVARSSHRAQVGDWKYLAKLEQEHREKKAAAAAKVQAKATRAKAKAKVARQQVTAAVAKKKHISIILPDESEAVEFAAGGESETEVASATAAGQGGRNLRARSGGKVEYSSTRMQSRKAIIIIMDAFIYFLIMSWSLGLILRAIGSKVIEY